MAATPAIGRFPATPKFQLDEALNTLNDRAKAWLDVPLERKIAYLAEVRRRTLERGEGLVKDAVAAKELGPEFEGEDWVGGIVPQMRTMRFLEETLRSIAKTGRPPFSEDDFGVTPDGQVTVRVMPLDRWDRLAYMNWTADVWLDPEVRLDEVWDDLGGIYTKPETATAAVAVALGAGNQASIAPLELIHKLFLEGHVAILKFNPVNEYIGPYVEYAFGELIRDGFVRVAYGGADVGNYLVRHPLVDEVHITGAAHTHDDIVYGTGEEGARRKANNEPLLDKPITSELGNVSPVIIMPGEWSEKAMRFHAEHLAAQMVQNGGFNCVAIKALILPKHWEQKEAFLAELRRVLLSLPKRLAYYPGAEERFDRFVDSHHDVELLGEREEGFVPPALMVGIDAEFDHLAFEEESFCSITATTEIGGADAAEYLRMAVDFCNDSLDGTLNVTLIVDPDTQKALSAEVEQALADLRYGTVSLNIWSGAGFALGQTPWGAFPGHTLDDIQSGIGFVHNPRLIDRPQKTVIRAPFTVFPKPPWFVTHRSATPALKAAAALDSEPSMLKLLKVVRYAVMG